MPGYYETNQAVSEYLLFHYGADPDTLPWPDGPASGLRFPERCVAFARRDAPLPPNARALDLGCAVGRVALELSRYCTEVVGVDNALPLIQAARTLATTGQVRFPILHSGHFTRECTASIPHGTRPERIRFEVADALDLPPQLGCFDLIVAANLLDRVPHPSHLLRSLPGRLNPGGRLLLTSPYTWLQEYTDPTEWLAAQQPSAVNTLAPLLPGLTLLDRTDLPFLLREHHRKYQWSVAEATLWIRTPE